LLENSLRTAVAKSTDAIFVAALIAGTTPIASSGDIFQDLRTAIAAGGSDSASRFHLIVGPLTAVRLALSSTTDGAVVFPAMTVNGGTLGGLAVHVSDALTDEALLIDASGLAANALPVELNISNQAAIEMDNAPSMTAGAGSPFTPTEATLCRCSRPTQRRFCAREFLAFH
jgi:hypothetical protein